jgi:hypothetical protein
MSIIQVEDTRQYYLTSSGENVFKFNGSMNSHVRYYLNNIVESNKMILYNNVKLSHCEFPYSFNNILIVNGISLIVNTGNYTAYTLQQNINQLLSENSITAQLSFSTSSGKYTLTSSNPITINQSSLYKIVGLENGNYIGIFNGSNYVIQFINPVNTGGIRNIYIKTNILTENTFTYNNNSGIIKSIPVNVPPFGIIMYNNNENIESLIKNKSLDYLDIELLDDNANLINFNGLDWSICLEIKVYKNFFAYNYDINEKV